LSVIAGAAVEHVVIGGARKGLPGRIERVNDAVGAGVENLRRHRGGARAVTAVTVEHVAPVTATASRRQGDGVTVAAFLAAIALAGVSGFFAITGMTAVFAAAPVSVMVMTGTIEAAKLVTAAWLARHWRSSPWQLRWPLATMVMVLMLLTAIFRTTETQ
jgi:hypothetical protein